MHRDLGLLIDYSDQTDHSLLLYPISCEASKVLH